ncbi:MAG: hypothetical protein IPI04_10975 [Ignavibacteria bacterium]|nr:hypothetical protein [Ignavibacteria bacterium]
MVDEIISKTKGINIDNNPSSGNKKVIIDANIIEGSNGNDGVIRSATGSNYVVRNAKIKNTATSSPSIGIYIETGTNTLDQAIELENLIIVTGVDTTDFSLFRDGTTVGIIIKNLGLFVKKDKNTLVTFAIGTSTNYKYVVSTDVA